MKSANNNQIKVRNSNIELLRIILMLMIVAHHYVVNSGLLELMYQQTLDVNTSFLWIFGAWGKTAINCFIFITGYFMSKSNITLTKYLKLLCQIIFYNTTIYFIFSITGLEKLSFEDMLSYINPIKSVNNSFVSCYLLFFLFIPFINILINNISQKQHLILIAICCFIYVILGSIMYFKIDLNYISWFIVLYLISAYIRFYPNKHFKNTKLWGIASIITLTISILSIFLMTIYSSVSNEYMAYFFVSDSNKIFAVSTAFSIFMLFINLNIKYCKFINLVGRSTFGVLLIHASSDTMRTWLWNDLLNNTSMINSDMLIIHAVTSVIMVFSICIIIDVIRIELIEKPILNKIDNKIDISFNKYFIESR
ncbi:MAG: acyltransferase [Oscillospiraceae bacterium]|nr:acyltransferase [Oscillospiraceae bacterium]